ELLAPILVFGLFVLFQVIANDQAGSLALPLATAHLLARATSDDAELMAIVTVDDDVGFRGSLESDDPESIAEVVVLLKLAGDVAQVLDCHFFVRANEHDVLAGTEKHLGQHVVVGEGRALGMAARGCDSALLCVGSIMRPAI